MQLPSLYEENPSFRSGVAIHKNVEEKGKNLILFLKKIHKNEVFKL